MLEVNKHVKKSVLSASVGAAVVASLSNNSRDPSSAASDMHLNIRHATSGTGCTSHHQQLILKFTKNTYYLKIDSKISDFVIVNKFKANRYAL